jgi:hypothetical protein
VKNKTQCQELSANGNRWVNHKYNFDNLGQALMSLFVLSSKDGWVSIMYQGLDAVGPDQQVIIFICLEMLNIQRFLPKFGFCSVFIVGEKKREK